MRFYSFRQNNSGGFFNVDLEDGLNETVIIEAENRDDAFDRAYEIGLYFDGVKAGRDCECCGDRWDRYCDEIETEDMIALDGISATSLHYADGRIINV